MIALLKQLLGFLTGGGIVWRVIRNYRVLSNSSEAISTIFNNMSVRGDKTPNIEETQELLKAISNILKTGVIDIPYVDEYKLSASIDNFQGAISLSIKDYSSGKYHTLNVKKEKPRKKKLELTDHINDDEIISVDKLGDNEND